MFFLKRQVHNAPRCPYCHYGLLLTFRGQARIPCPECANEVTIHDSTYHVSRRGFLMVGCLGVIFIPLLAHACCWVVWLEHLADEQSPLSQRLMFISLFATLVYQMIAPIVLFRWYSSHRQYLSGKIVWPPGWLMLVSITVGWIVTTVLLGVSMVYWWNAVPV